MAAMASMRQQDHEGMDPFDLPAQATGGEPLMGMTSTRHQDHEGIGPVDAEESHRSLEPSDLLQENTDYRIGIDEEVSSPVTETSSSSPVTENNSLNPVRWTIGDNVVRVQVCQRNIQKYLPLYQAAQNGDWESAKSFIDHDPTALTASISTYEMTALHVAAAGGRSLFVEKLVERMSAKQLAQVDARGRTALHYGAVAGTTKVAKAMVRKNPALTQTADMEGLTPIILAAMGNSKDMLWYLSLVTTDEPPSSPFTGPYAGCLICSVTGAGFHDVAVYLLRRYPNLATASVIDKAGVEYSALRLLAETPSAFQSGSKFGFWSSCIYRFVPAGPNYAPPHKLQGDVEDHLKNSGDLAEGPTSTKSQTYLTRGLRLFTRLLWKAIAQLVPDIKKVHDEKLRHKQSVELLKNVCIQMSQSMNNLEIMAFIGNSSILNIATSYGIMEIVKECLQFFPEMAWCPDSTQRYILHVAVEHRRENIFNLLWEKTALNKLMASTILESQNNILHLAAKLPPPHQLKCVSGAALQIQRELQWFKEVEKFIFPSYKEFRNSERKTAWEVFTEEHKNLVENGEKWMKDTSNSCMVVATLIATVMFAAPFTVPGGNNSNGIAMFLKRNSFMVFVISDALGLFSASTALLMFLSILTARFAEEDFLLSLPKRLIIGLTSLFFAVATMMIAFSATLSIVLDERFKWAYIPIASMAFVPVLLFVMLQLPLYIQMVQSTYGSGLFQKKGNLKL